MVTYLEVLNRARARQGGTPLNATVIAQNIGDSLQGIQALNNAIAVFHENSFDLEGYDKVASITTTASTGLLTPPNPSWDTNVIKAVKYQKAGETVLTPLILINLQTAEDYKLLTFTENDPKYWYTYSGQIYILPVPTIGYSLKVFYQQMQPDITSDNITNAIMLPDTVLKTLQDLVYAYLREQVGDPQWGVYYQKAEQQVVKFYQRNKHTNKRQGMQKVRYATRKGDRKL